MNLIPKTPTGTSRDETLWEARTAEDKRRRATPLISRYSFSSGRRRGIRRHEDKEKFLYVDRYNPRLFLVLLLLLLLNLADSFFTLFLTSHGAARETNPIMAFFLGLGDLHFITAKHLFSSFAVFIFCIFHTLPFVRASLIAAVLLYFGIVAYEIAFITHWLSL
jgi:hypothetical protein